MSNQKSECRVVTASGRGRPLFCLYKNACVGPGGLLNPPILYQEKHLMYDRSLLFG